MDVFVDANFVNRSLIESGDAYRRQQTALACIRGSTYHSIWLVLLEPCDLTKGPAMSAAVVCGRRRTEGKGTICSANRLAIKHATVLVSPIASQVSPGRLSYV